METTLSFAPQFFGTRSTNVRGRNNAQNVHIFHPLCATIRVSLKMKLCASSRSSFLLHRRIILRTNKKFSINSSDQFQSVYFNTESTSAHETVSSIDDDKSSVVNLYDTYDHKALQPQHKMFWNRFLDFVRIRSVINNAAESCFKSEIRRRLFVTAVLIVFSRPLPGFDRRLMPQDYLSFTSGSVDELGDLHQSSNYHFFSWVSALRY